MKIKIFFVMLIIMVSLVSAGNYGEGIYGAGVYVGENITTPETPTPTPSPTQESPSSSGGSSCIYDWQCTDWFPTPCPESGIQERICANKGTCTGTKNIPNQTQSCKYAGPTEPLFDIFLTIPSESRKVCSENKINANIMLKNYGKIELLNAYMTYWIINENNTLIVELKDTRAVKNTKEFKIELQIPESTPKGTYRLYAQINYEENKTAVAGNSFEIIQKENCISQPLKKEPKQIYMKWSLTIIIILLLLIFLIKMFKTKFKIIRKRSKKEKTPYQYKRKIRENLKKIKSKNYLIIFLATILTGILLIKKDNITGFVVNNLINKENNWNAISLILIMGILGLLTFLSRNKIKISIEQTKEKIKNKYPKDSIRGLIKKKVYTEEAEYLGIVKEINLNKYKISDLKIKLNKKQKYGIKGIIIEYKEVKGVGDIVIVNQKILEDLKRSEEQKL